MIPEDTDVKIFVSGEDKEPLEEWILFSMSQLSVSIQQLLFFFLLLYYHSCSLSTATIEYSCSSVCLCVCVQDNPNNIGSVHLKLEYIVVYEKSSDKFNIGHCPIKVKVMV